ncbi:MAG: hypothetical protein JWM37_699 [Candidatus Saccharibacteria bacterium]|nr:hypothetical protein [Candidatus Saccharibacteria bacterium]
MKKLSRPQRLTVPGPLRPVARFVKANLRLVGLVAAIIIVGGGILAWRFLYYDRPSQAWQDMLTKSVQTKSVTLTSSQRAAAASNIQTIKYRTGNDKLATSETDVTQQSNTLKVETIGTADAEYARYTAINVAGIDSSKVLNVWAKLDHKNQAPTDERQLLADAVLRLGNGYGIILADVPAGQRDKILNELQDKVLTVDTAAAKRESFNNQSVYAYDLKVNPQAYNTYLKDMSAATGIKTNSYDFTISDPTPTPLRLYVSRSSHRLVGLMYPQLSSYQETYDQYDQPVTVTIPGNTITYDELAKRLVTK